MISGKKISRKDGSTKRARGEPIALKAYCFLSTYYVPENVLVY